MEGVLIHAFMRQRHGTLQYIGMCGAKGVLASDEDSPRIDCPKCIEKRETIRRTHIQADMSAMGLTASTTFNPTVLVGMPPIVWKEWLSVG